MTNTSLQPIGITMGDPAGIGPEIVVKLLTGEVPWPCIVYGDSGCLHRAAQALGITCHIQVIDSAASWQSRSDSQATQPVIRVIETCAVDPDLPLGQVSAAAGQSAYQSVSRAIDDALAGQIRAMVTAPLNKESIGLTGIDFPGHTEILAARSGNVPVAMMLVNQTLRVILVTIHVALRDVPALLTTELELQTIQMAALACRQLGIPNPRVAVAGLNPHAGENGKFGDEELRIINPAIEQARAKGIQVSGPWPGDTIFARAHRGEFDIVVAQYHDQGLIPVKYLGLDEGVNVTVGLPFIRTSVDHGTAFDIAGKGIASPDSLMSALRLADALSQQRTH